VAALPLNFYKGDTGERERVRNLDLVRMFTEQPNEYMTAQEFREAMTMQLVLFGNAYAYRQKNGAGKTISLDIMQAECMDVIRKIDGEIRYIYQRGKLSNYAEFYQYVYNDTKDDYAYYEQFSSVVRVFKPTDIFHLKGFGTTGLTGLSPLAYARNVLGMATNAEDYGRNFFKNGGKPSGVLMVDKVLTKEQRAAIRDNFEGLSNYQTNNRLWVLEASMKYQAISIPPEDAQFLTSRQFEIGEIARFFNVPTTLLNHGDKASTMGNSLEQQNQSFVTYCLTPYLLRWENVIKRTIIAEWGSRQEGLFAEHNVEGLLRADSKGRASFYEIMTRNGIMTRNECRAKENLPPVDGGDFATAQAQNIPLIELSNNEG
jgi:HK97 family phage portal protein